MKVILRPLMPPLVVQPFEIGALDLAERAIGRRRPAIGDGLPDLDLGIADAGAVLLLGPCRLREQQGRGCDK
jgi:hypothetical protein